MKLNRPKSAAGFTLVEIMIVVLIIGILLAIAIPNFVAARETSRAKACVGNLKQIDSACQQYAMDSQSASSAWKTVPTLAGLSGQNGYIRAVPVCPEGGTYTLPTAPMYEPICSISGGAAGVNSATAVTGTETGTDYLAGGKWYHGLSD